MEKYKRLTVRHPNSDYIAITETKQLQETRESKIVLNRLAELEDKIENGTIKEVVRCKDCKCLEELHYEEVGEKPYIKNVCRLFKRTMQLNDFCSYALPKEQQNEQQRKAD